MPFKIDKMKILCYVCFITVKKYVVKKYVVTIKSLQKLFTEYIQTMLP